MKVIKIPVNTRALSSKSRSAIKIGINNVFLKLMNFYNEKQGNEKVRCSKGFSLQTHQRLSLFPLNFLRLPVLVV